MNLKNFDIPNGGCITALVAFQPGGRSRHVVPASDPRRAICGERLKVATTVGGTVAGWNLAPDGEPTCTRCKAILAGTKLCAI